jgi:hypothetical protein
VTLDPVPWLFDDQLTPVIDRSRLGPSLVDVVHVDVVVDIQVLEEMETEQRQIGVGPRGHIRERAGSGDPRVDLSQVNLVGVRVHEDIDLEESAIPLLGQPVTQALDHLPRGGLLVDRERARPQVIAAPTALVWRQLPEARQMRH